MIVLCPAASCCLLLEGRYQGIALAPNIDQEILRIPLACTLRRQGPGPFVLTWRSQEGYYPGYPRARYIAENIFGVDRGEITLPPERASPQQEVDSPKIAQQAVT